MLDKIITYMPSWEQIEYAGQLGSAALNSIGAIQGLKAGGDKIYDHMYPTVERQMTQLHQDYFNCRKNITEQPRSYIGYWAGYKTPNECEQILKEFAKAKAHLEELEKAKVP